LIGFTDVTEIKCLWIGFASSVRTWNFNYSLVFMDIYRLLNTKGNLIDMLDLLDATLI